MASNQGHHVGSLPNDYAILARFANEENDATDSEQAVDSDGDDEINSRRDSEDSEGASYQHHIRSMSPRRSSFPTTYIRPQSPAVASMNFRTNTHDKHHNGAPDLANVNEDTPLLGPYVPRIEEEQAGDDDMHKSFTAMFWEELRILAKYTVPVFGTHVLEYSLMVASVISIGHISTTALAAATLGSMTASVSGLSIAQGFTSTLDTMLPSAWTSPQPNLVGLWSQRMTVVMAATLIPIYAIWFNAESILLGLKQEPEVARLAGEYLKWLSIGLPAYTFNGISRRYFQCQGLFAVPTRIILVVAPINALLNWLLVWGPEPIRMGFKGAPLATAISFNIVSIASVVYGVVFVPKTAWHPISTRSFKGLGILVQLGMSGVGQTASEWWSWELVGLAASLLGPVSLATQSVLLVSASTTFQAPFALGVAVSVRIGNLLGEHKAKRAGVAANTSIVLAIIIALFWSLLFLVFRSSWAHLFNDDPEVVSLVASIIPLVALFQVFDGISAVTNGVLRARGRQFTGALLNLSAYYVIGIPFGVWLAFKHGMKLHGLWIGLTVSLVYCAAWGVYLCLRTDWKKEVQKVMDRLAAEQKRGQEDAERGTN